MASGHSASKMIAPKVVVRLLTLVLLYCFSRQGSLVRGASFFEQQQQEVSATTEFPYGLQYPELSLIEPTQERQQQQLHAVDENLSQDNNLKRYLLKDLDLGGYSQNQPLEAWKLIRLSQLLDSLSSSIPTTPTPTRSPIYRSGRTFPTLVSNAELDHRLRLAPDRRQQQLAVAGAASSRVESADPQQLLLVQPNERLQFDKQQQQGLFEKNTKARSPTVLGIAWPQTNKRRSQAINANGESKGSQQHHRQFGTEEVAMNTPMHSRLANHDYESKRVEPNRGWSRLAGLWGKRAAANGEPPHFSAAGGGNTDQASTSSQVASLLEIQHELEVAQRFLAPQDATDKQRS